MKKYFCFIILLMIIVSITSAQTPREKTIINVFGRLNLTEENQYEYLTYWTDGGSFYRPFFYDNSDYSATFRSDGNTIYFCGGDLHEGGIRYEVKLAADGTMTMAGDYRYNQGDRMEYRVVAGEPLLIISDVKTKAVKDVWKKLEKGDLRALYLNNYLRYVLAGTYKSDDGKTITFPNNRFCVSGLWDGNDCATYTFGEEYESPVLTLVFSKKDKAFVVRKTLTGLELYPAKFSKDDALWEKDNSKPIVLTKTAEGWSNLLLEGKQGIRGRFTLVSEKVMTKSELREYAGYPALQNLKIMRNEIYARYGYKFKTKDMIDYFGTKEWYTPQYDDVSQKLTEIERINVALIQELEKNADTPNAQQQTKKMTDKEFSDLLLNIIYQLPVSVMPNYLKTEEQRREVITEYTGNDYVNPTTFSYYQRYDEGYDLWEMVGYLNEDNCNVLLIVQYGSGLDGFLLKLDKTLNYNIETQRFTEIERPMEMPTVDEMIVESNFTNPQFYQKAKMFFSKKMKFHYRDFNNEGFILYLDVWEFWENNMTVYDEYVTDGMVVCYKWDGVRFYKDKLLTGKEYDN